VNYNPEFHDRRSIRLDGYDYTSAAFYFVTVCTFERELSLTGVDVSAVVAETWEALPTQFPGIELDEFRLMPNHVHGIIVLGNDGGSALGDVMRAFKSISAKRCNSVLGLSGHPFWQRNYYERVIRNERELEAVRQYIRDNPLKWNEDPNNPERMSQTER
jgi:REP element-mobilizing transposase RayT